MSAELSATIIFLAFLAFLSVILWSLWNKMSDAIYERDFYEAALCLVGIICLIIIAIVLGVGIFHLRFNQ